MNISLTGDRGGVSSSILDTTTATPSGNFLTPAAGGSAGEDRLSVTPATVRIHDTLSSISNSRAAGISRLQSLYASGRYDASASRTAQAMVAGALTNNNNI